MNPYESSVGDSSVAPRRRGVRRHLLLSLVLCGLGSSILTPGLLLLNQELGIIPVNFNLLEIEFAGIAISADRIMLISLIVGLGLLSISLLPASIGIANFWANRHRASHTQSRPSA